jgi:hypothetical protein
MVVCVQGYPLGCVCVQGYPLDCVCVQGYPLDCVCVQGYPLGCVCVQGYPLAGLEDADECYCGGNTWDSDNVYRLGPADNCNTRCKGDASAFCGGSWALSVYLTDTLDSQCHCSFQ